MTIEALVLAVPPPASPFEAFTGPWERIEAELGTPLPEDYKDFIRLYGSGYFMEFLSITVPSSWNPNVRLVTNIQLIPKFFQNYEENPFPYWPSPGGLISFGSTDNGDILFWLARGMPADWRIVVWDRDMGDFEVLDCDLTGFLAGLATGETLPKAFPEDLLPSDCLFEPRSAKIARWRLGFEAAKPEDALCSLRWRWGALGVGRSGISWED